MPHQHCTTFTDREQFVQLHQGPCPYRTIEQRCGWKAATIGKHCRAFQKHGAIALQPRRPGRPRCGILSTFHPVVRFAALRVKREHPAWGPAVVLDELRQRPSTRQQPLPQGAQLAAYFHQFGARLIQPRRHLQLPPPLPSATPENAGLVFQLDMQERLHLPQLGYFNVLQLRAPAWGVTVGCYPHPAGAKRWQRKVSLPEAREDCRRTFERWGLPDVLQMDHDKVLVGTGEYPFPSLFTLWLVGLGILHRLIARVTQNGSVERTHRTFDKQMLSGAECADWSAYLAYVAAEQKRLNARVPSRAKACRGQIPLVAHPEALTPRRPYHHTQEGEVFAMQRVYAYLAGGRWLRHTAVKGQFKFADRVWNAGVRYAHQTVVITFEVETRTFGVSTTAGERIQHLPSDWLTEATIRGLPDV